MSRRYTDVYPSRPLLNSRDVARASAAELLTLEYFEADPGSMPEEVFDEHHVLLNLREEPQRVENWRAGEHRDFTFQKNEVVVTPAGVRSGWRWHGRSKVIVVTLLPEHFERFAQREVGVILATQQLRDVPRFRDAALCTIGVMLRDALTKQSRGSDVLFEAMARAFLVKLIECYGALPPDEVVFSEAFTAESYRRVMTYIESHIGDAIGVEQLAREAALSPSHFSRLFKRAVGTSPMRFVMSCRVDEAKRRLASVDVPLAQVALGCGFADQAHFSRSFKRSTGQTPSAYRAALRGQQDRSEIS